MPQSASLPEGFQKLNGARAISVVDSFGIQQVQEKLLMSFKSDQLIANSKDADKVVFLLIG